MSNLAVQRLTEERRLWRKDHPAGFVARPRTQSNAVNMLIWDCGIPGVRDTPWDGGMYPLTMEFTEDYPTRPPKCRFPKGFYHPNIYPSGTILLGIQELLNTPNTGSPAQRDAYQDIVNNRNEYNRRIAQQRAAYDQNNFSLG